MKFREFLAFLFTLIAIIIVVAALAIEYSGGFVVEESCEGYSLFLFPDQDKLDTEVGKGALLRLRIINAGDFSDKYQVSLTGPEWAVIKPTSFNLKSEESRSLFLYVSPGFDAEGKYDLEVVVESKCVTESQRIEVGVLKK